MPDPDRLVRTLFKAADAVKQTPGRKGRFVSLHHVDDILIAGDMHGHLANFQAIYQAADLAHHPRRHLVLQELVHGKHFYPTGGDKSHQLVDLFAALKLQFPQQVHYLLGNHELAQWSDRFIMKDDRDLNALFRVGVEEAYGSRGDEIYQAYMRLFSVLPLALRTPNRIFISHSLPRSKFMDAFQLRLLETDAFAATDLNVGGVVYELTWGRDTRPETCAAFLQRVDCDWLVTGHIAQETGFALPNPQQLIVDCCDRPAAYTLLATQRPITQDEFINSVRMIAPST